MSEYLIYNLIEMKSLFWNYTDQKSINNRILIVGNNYFNRIIIEKILKYIGTDITNISIVSNWQNTIKKINNWDFSVVLVDNNISGNNTSKISKAIKQVYKIPVVVYNSNKNSIKEIY